MRTFPHYTTKEEMDRINTTNYTKYPVKQPVIPTPIFDLPPPIELGDPRAFDHPKKELIRILVSDPEKREEAKKAAQLEQQSGAKQTPITDVLMQTTQAHESAMSAPTLEQSDKIAKATAEEIIKKEKRWPLAKVFKQPLFTSGLGILFTLIIIKLLPQK